MTIHGGSTIDQSSAERRCVGTTPTPSRESSEATSAGIEPASLIHRPLGAAADRASGKRRHATVAICVEA